MKSMILQWLFSILRDNKEAIIGFIFEQGYDIFNKDSNDKKEIDALKSDIGNLRKTSKDNGKIVDRLDSAAREAVAKVRKDSDKLNALAVLVEQELNKTNNQVSKARDLIDNIVDDADNTKTTLGERIGDLSSALSAISKDVNVVKNTYSKKRVRKESK